MFAPLRSATREVLQRMAVAGASFDTDEFVALSGVAEEEAFGHLDDALAARIVEPASAGYRFRHCLIRDALTSDVPAHRRRQVHRDTARRLVELGASPARIGHHFLAAGAGLDAVPHLLSAAETESAVGAYRDALALVDAIRPHAVGPCRTRVLALRADLLTATGDPMAGPAYREALGGAGPADARRLRARLANSAVMAGDLATAAAALDGLDTDGGADDADILLARGKYAFFTADFDAARIAAEQAQRLILAGERNWQVLDLVTLRGLLAHRSGRWFAQMGAELHRTREDPGMAGAIFDGYLCSAEYLLYGPTPYGEVMELARDLRGTAERSGARRAAAFARALSGEAALLSGDLDLAAAELTEASAEHRDLGSGAGEAHSLQRLAEVRLAQGDDAEARRLLERALPLARNSIVAKHLLHRVFGTMIRAAAAGPRPGWSPSGPSRCSAGTTSASSARSCWPCPRPSRAPATVTWMPRAATWRPLNARRRYGGTPPGRPGWPRRRRRSPPPAAIPARRGPGCSGRPASSSGPASRLTPNAAAGPSA